MLLGRERELASLIDASRSAEAGRGSTLLVMGEPGIGKTALLNAAGDADHGWWTLRSTGVEPERTVAFATLQGLLWPVRDVLDELDAGQATALKGVLELGPPAGASTFAIGAATLSLLSVSSRERPVIMIVDDAHWADTTSQEVLAFVGRRLGYERIALLLGHRTEEPSLLAEERSFTRIELQGLEAGDARTLLDHSATDALSAEVAERLLDTCAGNPLGLVELPQLLTESQRRGQEPLPEALAAGPLVQRAFAARVAELAEAAQEALLTLAAAGESDLAIRAMTDDMRGSLDDAEAAGLVGRRGRIDFRHPLLGAAVYGAAAPAARRDAHRRLAAADTGARRAWHLAEAVEGPDEEVAHALEESSAEARAAGGVAAEAQALERAAGLSPHSDRRAARLLGAARAWRLAGRQRRAAELLDVALPLARSTRTRAEIQLERGYGLFRDRRFRDAHELLVAEARRAEADEPSVAARLHAAVALVANDDPEAPDAIAPAERALVLAAGRGDDAELDALFAAVSARMRRPVAPNEDDERLVFRAAELLEKRELRTGERPHWIAYALAELERDQEARRLSELALAEARTDGDVWSLCYGLFARAALELVAGRVDAARSWAAEGRSLAEEIGEPWRVHEARAVQVEVEAARGELDACERFAVQTSPEPDPVDVALHLGRALLAHDRPGDAVPHLETAARAFSEGLPRGWYRLVPLDLAEAYIYAGRAKDAETLLARAAPAIEQCRLVRPRAKLARVRGLLASEAKVDVAFEASRVLLEEVAQPLERARVELCWGERLGTIGRAGDAVPHLERALTAFNALGAPGWADRTRATLGRVSGSERPAEHRRSDALTAHELRIAHHAASGLRNREIAALLYLSPRTVEWHLQSAYRKLDVSNRTQLAAVLTSEGIRSAGAVEDRPAEAR
jgi:DNA-binding CsgD family transcriptional regulator